MTGWFDALSRATADPRASDQTSRGHREQGRRTDFLLARTDARPRVANFRFPPTLSASCSFKVAKVSLPHFLFKESGKQNSPAVSPHFAVSQQE
jgi:hypothetical protein